MSAFGLPFWTDHLVLLLIIFSRPERVTTAVCLQKWIVLRGRHLRLHTYRRERSSTERAFIYDSQQRFGTSCPPNAPFFSTKSILFVRKLGVILGPTPLLFGRQIRKTPWARGCGYLLTESGCCCLSGKNICTAVSRIQNHEAELSIITWKLKNWTDA